MIITKTPFRMSFFGGGTDLPDFFRENGGAVLSTTFDKYCYVTVRHLPPFFDYSSEICYARTERVTRVADIEHPAVRNAMAMLDMHELRLTYEADLPSRSGLGTSSSFAVGMLNAFYALKGKYADKKRLADDAIKLERELCREAGGWQDQIAAAFGGLNRINFDADGYTVDPVIISPERKSALEDSLMMFFTGFTRFSADVQASLRSSMRDKTAELREMLALVDVAENVLVDKSVPLDDFGRLLDETWKLKRGISSSVSTDSIDGIYASARKAGALGGKLLGAGGGAGASSFLRISAFMAFTMANTHAARMTNDTTALMKLPTMMGPMCQAEKSMPGVTRLMMGVSTSATRLLTMEVNAPPTTTPTAISSTLPFRANVLNSSSNFFM